MLSNYSPFLCHIHWLLADDTAMFTSSKITLDVWNRLQTSIIEFEKWYSWWELDTQSNNVQLIHFSSHPHKRYSNPIHFQIPNTTIRPQSSARYLGFIFNQRLRWRSHVTHIRLYAAEVTKRALVRSLMIDDAVTGQNSMLLLDSPHWFRSTVSFFSLLLVIWFFFVFFFFYYIESKRSLCHVLFYLLQGSLTNETDVTAHMFHRLAKD